LILQAAQSVHFTVLSEVAFSPRHAMLSARASHASHKQSCHVTSCTPKYLHKKDAFKPICRQKWKVLVVHFILYC